MAKTMQQQDHDAWELGYGNRYSTDDHNNLELDAMREALRRKAEEEAKSKTNKGEQ